MTLSDTDLKRRLNAQLGDILGRRVATLFKPGTRLAIIARTPGNDEADVLVTDDDIASLIALLERSATREVVA